jgi:hypothetical protein
VSDSASDVYDLLRSSASRWHTVALEGTEWRHHDRLLEAAKRSTEKDTPLTSARYRSSASATRAEIRDQRDSTTESWRLWVAPGHKRAHYLVGGEVVDVVFEGATWWSVGRNGALTNAGRENHGHGSGWGAALIDTRAYVRFLEVREVERATFLGRDVKVVRATPLWDEAFKARIALHALVLGAGDDLVLTIDAERGVILRAESRLEGEPYRVLEVTAIGFDEELAEDTFTLRAPAGQAWQEVEHPPSTRPLRVGLPHLSPRAWRRSRGDGK